MSPETRETVKAVADLAPGHKEGVRQTILAERLGLDRGTVSRRVRKALDGGYLRNLEEKRGKPHRLVPGDPLPDELVILPEPDELHGCTVAEPPPPQGADGRPSPERADEAEIERLVDVAEDVEREYRQLGIEPDDDGGWAS